MTDKTDDFSSSGQLEKSVNPSKTPTNVLDNVKDVSVPKYTDKIFESSKKGYLSWKMNKKQDIGADHVTSSSQDLTTGVSKESSDGANQVSFRSQHRDTVENLRKETERITRHIHRLEGQLAAREASLDSRKAFKEREQTTLTKTVAISSTSSEPTQVPESMQNIVDRIITESASQACSSHSILDPNYTFTGGEDESTREQQFQSLLKPLGQSQSFRKHLQAHICSESRQRVERRKILKEQYLTLRDAWIDRIQKNDLLRSKDSVSASKERDWWLLRAIRGRDSITKGVKGRDSSFQVETFTDSANNTSADETGSHDLEFETDTDSRAEHWRNGSAKLPEQIISAVPFDGGNVLYENPVVETYFDTLVNPWTRAERIIFLRKFLLYGKNFRKIASFLEYKTTDDVVRYYFRNKLKLSLKQLSKETYSSRQHSAKVASAILAASGFPAEVVSRRWILDNFKGEKPQREDCEGIDNVTHVPPPSSESSRIAFNKFRKLAGLDDEDRELKSLLNDHGFNSIVSSGQNSNSPIVYFDIGRDGFIYPVGSCLDELKARRQLEKLVERRRSGSWKVKKQKKRNDVKVYYWTRKEQNTFSKFIKEIGCDWERLSEYIPSKTPSQIHAFYNEWLLQRNMEESEDDSNYQSPSFASDGGGRVTRSSRRKHQARENISNKRPRTSVSESGFSLSKEEEEQKNGLPMEDNEETSVRVSGITNDTTASPQISVEEESNSQEVSMLVEKSEFNGSNTLSVVEPIVTEPNMMSGQKEASSVAYPSSIVRRRMLDVRDLLSK